MNDCESCKHDYNLSVLDPTNENLMSAQKALLLDHFCLGHIGIDHLHSLYQNTLDQELGKLSCLIPKHANVMSCMIPMCLACHVTKAKKSSINYFNDDSQFGSSECFDSEYFVGEQVFVDQYESNIQGRLPTSHGSEPSLTKYCGGTLFFNAASQLNQIFINHHWGVLILLIQRISLNMRQIIVKKD